MSHERWATFGEAEILSVLGKHNEAVHCGTIEQYQHVLKACAGHSEIDGKYSVEIEEFYCIISHYILREPQFLVIKMGSLSGVKTKP